MPIPHPTRRSAALLTLAAPSLLGACVAGAPKTTIPGRGFLFAKGDRDPIIEISGTGFSADSPFRVASISKVVTTLTARALAREGALDLHADISAWLPATTAAGFRHPAHPDSPITTAHLLAHLSGVRDPARYWVPAPGAIADILGPDIFAPDAKPGAFFRYANLNYGLAATVMEAATGERFDRLATSRVLAPLGLDAGFNWSGVSPTARARASALYRGGPGAWKAQIDGAVDPAAPSILAEPDYDLATYIPGTNGTLFSPQGGLRASLADLLVIARRVLAEPALHSPVWTAATDPGDTADGHFTAFGPGLYIYPAERSPVPGVKLVGHVGEAYGFYGGMWAAPDHDAVFAFGTLGSPPEAAGGVPMTGGSPNVRATSANFYARAAQLLA